MRLYENLGSNQDVLEQLSVLTGRCYSGLHRRPVEVDANENWYTREDNKDLHDMCISIERVTCVIVNETLLRWGRAGSGRSFNVLSLSTLLL